MGDNESAAEGTCFHPSSDEALEVSNKYFDTLFGPRSDVVVKKIVSYLSFIDIRSCCQATDLCKAKLIDLHRNDPQTRQRFETAKAHYDWFHEDPLELTMHLKDDLDTSKFRIKDLQCDGNDVILLLESYYDANSPDFLDAKLTYVVSVWNDQKKMSTAQHVLEVAESTVTRFCYSKKHIFLMYGGPLSSTVTILSRATGELLLNFNCAIPGCQDKSNIEAFWADRDSRHLYSWHGKRVLRKYAIEEDSGELKLTLLNKIKVEESSRAEFKNGWMLCATKYVVSAYDLATLQEVWSHKIKYLVASIWITDNRAIIEGLTEEYLKTSFLIYNLENGQLVKGCTVFTNELIKTCVSSDHLFLNFRDSQLTNKLVIFDVRTGLKVGTKEKIGHMLQANIFNNRMILLSTASLKYMDRNTAGTAEIFCFDLWNLNESKGRLLDQDDVSGTKDLQKVLNHQKHYYAYGHGIIKDRHGKNITFMEFVQPLNFLAYPHDHDGCEFAGI